MDSKNLSPLSEEVFKFALKAFMNGYKSDLIFIKYFNLFKSGKISFDFYLEKCPGNFRRFLYEFGVARNIAKGKVNPFLKTLKQFVSNSENPDVDALAVTMRNAGFTHKKTMTSLCSKTLFLYKPGQIIPIDRFAKKALQYKGNNYKEFELLLQAFGAKNKSILKHFLHNISEEIDVIEVESGIDNIDFKQVRECRYMDYLIWTIGKSLLNK